MSKITVSICQSNYIPWRGYFDLIGFADYFVLYDNVQYTKNDWRNRNKIKTPNGAEWLTIACKTNSINQRIDETFIANTNWYVKHLKTIKSNYAKAAAFGLVYDWIEEIYVNKISHLTKISDINKCLITEICKFLNIQTTILSDNELELIEGKSEKLIHICSQLKADVYLSGPSAQDYLDLSLFHENNIDVIWMDYTGYPSYSQQFGEFNPNLSIIDLLFNEGLNAKEFLKSKDYDKNRISSFG